ncbi:MAG TPA: hypothetical protein VK887_07830, partial [Pseudonocardiaceae bacterium]|nr:hypothetical protein [Pseudonocardiaceae bacterium]
RLDGVVECVFVGADDGPHIPIVPTSRFLWSGLSGSKTFRRVSGPTERITVSLDAGVAAGLKAAVERGWRS